MFRMLRATAGTKAKLAAKGTHLATTQQNEDNQSTCGIRDVWAANMEKEFVTIRNIIRNYPYVAMDTEYPGIVARPKGEFRDHNEYKYQEVRCNVDLLTVIQIGFSFMDEAGNSPQPITTWQFNFKFNIEDDMYAQDSIELLQKCGIQFARHEEEGIAVQDFAELLITSGVVLMENVKWLSFHSCYDFGYLLKVLTNQQMPPDEQEFFELLNIYFPNIYDIKYLLKFTNLKGGGLQELANQLEIRRIGPQHQAGSDSLLTGHAFFKMREVHFGGVIDEEKFRGLLYGLSEEHGPGKSSAPYGLSVDTLPLVVSEPTTFSDQQATVDSGVAPSAVMMNNDPHHDQKYDQHDETYDQHDPSHDYHDSHHVQVGDSGYDPSHVVPLTDVNVNVNVNVNFNVAGDVESDGTTALFQPPAESTPRLLARQA